MELRMLPGRVTAQRKRPNTNQSMRVDEGLVTVITVPVYCAIFTDFHSSMSHLLDYFTSY